VFTDRRLTSRDTVLDVHDEGVEDHHGLTDKDNGQYEATGAHRTRRMRPQYGRVS